MNLSECMTSIKMDLGLIGLNLPVTDEDLYNVIKLKTLKTFNVYFPRILSLDLDLRTLKCRQNTFKESIYELPDVFGDYRVVTIKDIQPRSKSSGGGFYSDGNPFSGMAIYGDIMMGQIEADLLSSISPAFTFKYVEPNLIYLYNCVTDGTSIRVEIGLEHFENLSSISYTLYDSFYDLAILDIKKFLYGILKNYEDLQTAYGNINLKIDEWNNSESDRKDLVTRWNDLYHLEANQFVII